MDVSKYLNLCWTEEHKSRYEFDWSQRLNYGYLIDRKLTLQSTLSQTTSEIENLKGFLAKIVPDRVFVASDTVKPEQSESRTVDLRQSPESWEPSSWFGYVKTIELTPDESEALGMVVTMRDCQIIEDVNWLTLSEYHQVRSSFHRAIRKISFRIQNLERIGKRLLSVLERIEFFTSHIPKRYGSADFFRNKILMEDPWHFFHGTHPPEASPIECRNFLTTTQEGARPQNS